MVTGKLEGAWRVVARSLPRHLPHIRMFSRERQERSCNLAPELGERNLKAALLLKRNRLGYKAC
jgi:hypothetical protein